MSTVQTKTRAEAGIQVQPQTKAQGRVLNFSPVAIDPALPSDPEVRAFARTLLGRVKHSFTTVAAEREPQTNSKLDATFRGFMASRSGASRQKYHQTAQGILATPQLRMAFFERYAEAFRQGNESASSVKMPVP